MKTEIKHPVRHQQIQGNLNVFSWFLDDNNKKNSKFHDTETIVRPVSIKTCG